MERASIETPFAAAGVASPSSMESPDNGDYKIGAVFNENRNVEPLQAAQPRNLSEYMAWHAPGALFNGPTTWAASTVEHNVEQDMLTPNDNANQAAVDEAAIEATTYTGIGPQEPSNLQSTTSLAGNRRRIRVVDRSKHQCYEIDDDVDPDL